MLKILSYFNLVIAVLYFLEYLQNSSPWNILGLLVVVIFNWMALRNLELQQSGWSFLQWVLAGISFFYALLLGYGAVVLCRSAMAYNYLPGDTLLLVISGFLFALTILFQLFISGSKIIRKKI